MMPGLSVDAKIMRERSVEDNYNITAGIGSIQKVASKGSTVNNGKG
jgi:hypothetical protein